MQKASST